MWIEQAIETRHLHRSGTIAEGSQLRTDDGSRVNEGHGWRMARVNRSVETMHRMFGAHRRCPNDFQSQI